MNNFTTKNQLLTSNFKLITLNLQNLKIMKKIILTLLILNFQLSIINCFAQSPVDNVGSGCTLKFDGSPLNTNTDIVNIWSSTTFDTIRSSFTIEIWFKANRLLPSWQRIVSKYRHVQRSGWGLHIRRLHRR